MNAPSIRSLAAKHGFHDEMHAGELARIFDGSGRRRRFLRKSGVSLDSFAEIVWDAGLTLNRPDVAEVIEMLEREYCTAAPKVDKRKRGRKQVATAIDAAERKARSMRLRKFVCESCSQIIRGSRNTIAICGLCYEMGGEIRTMVRVDPLPEEILSQAGGI